MTIETVKIQSEGWLVNSTMFVPNDSDNPYYVEIQKWIADGNTPSPEFTNAEISANAQQEINKENLAYLASTDWYIIRKSDTGEAIPKNIKAARVQSRLLIIE